MPRLAVTISGAAFAALLAVSGPSAANDRDAAAPSPQGLARITSFFDEEVASGRLPGAVLLIQQHGRPVYFRCFGFRDATIGAPMTADTLFAIRSMTKPITSVAALMLLDQGKLSLDDPVSKFIPSFGGVKVGIESVDANGKPAFKLVDPDRPVTVADLLRHTAAISYVYVGGALTREAYANARLFDGHIDNAEFAERIARLPLARQPGKVWRYGHATDVLGRVIEVISGQSLYQFMRANILEPMGMRDTKFVLETDAERARMAEGLPTDTVLMASERERRAHPEWESGGGGLVSTAADYARFAQMLLNGGELDGKRYLEAATFKLMTTDQIGPDSGVARDWFYYPGDGFGFSYGLAVRTDLVSGKPPLPGSLGELNWFGGGGTAFVVDPKRDMIYIQLQQTDRERARMARDFRKLVYDAFADGPFAPASQAAAESGPCRSVPPQPAASEPVAGATGR